ncbi:MAG: recombination protein RecR [Paludibacteraceae bacterium]|nr:recombination protein RecR [Paludibacteraceae bacterium]MBR6105605.1 recombination protein RecR [Paludibacteraceae bacterium]
MPGIGKKSALRIMLHLLKRPNDEVERLGNSIINARNNIGYCKVCHNISDTETCAICADQRRDAHTLCVVENIQDVMSIENTQQYNGRYHVLGGIISPMDGIGPNDLTIDSLEERVKAGGINEVILALSATIEGDTTSFYIYKKLVSTGVKITTLARGVAVGDSLQYADEVTLGSSLLNRIPFSR